MNSRINEWGRSFYKAIVQVESVIVKVLSPQSQTWYRNSLYQNYFAFGSSDIDLSIQLSSNKNLFDKATQIHRLLSLCPLNKEINFYSPFSLQYLPFLANPYEVARDPKLAQLVSIPEEDLEAKQFVYLLRMLYSNLKQIQNGLTKRDIEKWKFHFSLIGFPEIGNILGESLSKEKLLQLIFTPFPQLNKETKEVLVQNIQDQIDQKTLHLQFIQSPSPQILSLLLPHQFCFEEMTETKNNLFLEKVFLSQLSWEVLALITQPTLFPEPGNTHLKNVQLSLKKFDFQEPAHEEKRRKLTSIIKDYADLLN